MVGYIGYIRVLDLILFLLLICWRVKLNVVTVKGSFACTSLDFFSELRNVKQNTPKESLATALPLLLRKCNGDARKKLLEPTLLNTIRSLTTSINQLRESYDKICGQIFYVDFLLTYSNSFPHHKNYSSMMSL